MLRTIVDMTFLLLAVIIIVVILKDTREREVVDNVRKDVEVVSKDLNSLIESNTTYLEKRINGTDERQDNYQSSTSRRIHVLEQRILKVETDTKQSTRITNTNINTINN